MKIALVHNSKARRGRRVFEQVAPQVRARDEVSSLQEIALSDLEGAELDVDRCIAVGGDGTVNATVEQALRGARASGRPLPELGIVPAGTGNNLAQGLALPDSPREAVDVALGGEARTAIDLWQVDAASWSRSSVLLQSGALGFPADIASRYESLRRFRLFRLVTYLSGGPAIYRLLALAGLLRQRRRERSGEGLFELRCVLPSETLQESVLAVFIGNERSLGGDFVPCPRARVDDGELDLCLVRSGVTPHYLDLFRRVAAGTHLELEEAITYRQSEGAIQLEFSRELPLLIDGDLREPDRVFSLRRHPERLRLVTPAGRAQPEAWPGSGGSSRARAASPSSNDASSGAE